MSDLLFQLPYKSTLLIKPNFVTIMSERERQTDVTDTKTDKSNRWKQIQADVSHIDSKTDRQIQSREANPTVFQLV